ncbi:hypothetical protein HOK68_05105 [Candidatus Woesearchaeota archaeon]|jgi:hypothetical protein|nr:hypothetical protein [Candidatus Woesearchaeota archaeon]MBT4387059.1 hypothetical protein [Candidatus Woesearchaeota archaeon]MBT4596184.1 hypothetical protein [Candidatus Woesearchaeota archaeon]MBT5741593.1 hypothetical protein [Candidatus Woesearchaeota archaeon]MBT6506127.1 hypothetical protein [Candidatus Woesearchaeota archaeon]
MSKYLSIEMIFDSINKTYKMRSEVKDEMIEEFISDFMRSGIVESTPNGDVIERNEYKVILQLHFGPVDDYRIQTNTNNRDLTMGIICGALGYLKSNPKIDTKLYKLN